MIKDQNQEYLKMEEEMRKRDEEKKERLRKEE